MFDLLSYGVGTLINALFASDITKRLGTAIRTVPSSRCPERLTARLAGGAVNVKAMMEERINIGFFEPGKSLVSRQCSLAEPFLSCFR